MEYVRNRDAKVRIYLSEGLEIRQNMLISFDNNFFSLAAKAQQRPLQNPTNRKETLHLQQKKEARVRRKRIKNSKLSGKREKRKET